MILKPATPNQDNNSTNIDNSNNGDNSNNEDNSFNILWKYKYFN